MATHKVWYQDCYAANTIEEDETNFDVGPTEKKLFMLLWKVLVIL